MLLQSLIASYLLMSAPPSQAFFEEDIELVIRPARHWCQPGDSAARYPTPTFVHLDLAPNESQWDINATHAVFSSTHGGNYCDTYLEKLKTLPAYIAVPAHRTLYRGAHPTFLNDGVRACRRELVERLAFEVEGMTFGTYLAWRGELVDDAECLPAAKYQ